jgi:hypothetical protein
MAMAKDSKQEYSEQETQRRFEAALRAARTVGHKLRTDMKVGRKQNRSTRAHESESMSRNKKGGRRPSKHG